MSLIDRSIGGFMDRGTRVITGHEGSGISLSKSRSVTDFSMCRCEKLTVSRSQGKRATRGVLCSNAKKNDMSILGVGERRSPNPLNAPLGYFNRVTPLEEGNKTAKLCGLYLGRIDINDWRRSDTGRALLHADSTGFHSSAAQSHTELHRIVVISREWRSTAEGRVSSSAGVRSNVVGPYLNVLSWQLLYTLGLRIVPRLSRVGRKRKSIEHNLKNFMCEVV
ncbi:hypothetical protein F5Y16DRAFT_237462 [Xylariaceae sp. FL0255]|nr:hypothetical protein F5Y16DRAFT_237462 [Xylariaceae sp. FL0255]